MSIHFRNFRSKYFYRDDKPTNLLLFCSKSNLFSQALADVTEEFQSLYKNTKKKILSDPPTSLIPSHDHNIHESRREASRSRMRTRSGGEIRSPSVSPERSPELPEIGSPASTASEGIPGSPQPEKEQDPGSWNNGAEQFCTVEFYLHITYLTPFIPQRSWMSLLVPLAPQAFPLVTKGEQTPDTAPSSLSEETM